MLFHNLRTGSIVATENADSIALMRRSPSYQEFVPAPAVEAAREEKPKRGRKAGKDSGEAPAEPTEEPTEE